MTGSASLRRAAALLALLGALVAGHHAAAQGTAARPASPASAPAAELYRRVPASPDGIGKAYMGREIAQVMGWQGAAWLEREEREREERGDLLLRELALRPGQHVADIGAGTGYHTRRMAPLVGPQGVVYAVDVQPEMLKLLEDGARRAGLRNVRPVLGSADSVKLAPASIDLALLVDVYHELEFPHEVTASIVQALRPGGRLVLVEYRAEDPRVPIKELHKMSEAQVRKEMAAHAALVWERTARTLPWQHVVIFRSRLRPGSGSAPDELKHQRHGHGRMRFEEQMAGVKDMGLHPRQRAHP